MDAVNNLGLEAFVNKFGNVVEKNWLCAASVYSLKPFASFGDLYNEFCSFIDALPEGEKKRLLCGFPDLGERMERLGLESRLEQSQCGVTALTTEEAALVVEYNKRYREKFGFPFVLCARMNNKDTIFLAIKSRLENEESTEVKLGIAEAKKIMLLRIKDVLTPPLKSRM